MSDHFVSLKCGNDVIIFDKNKVEIGKGKAVLSDNGQVGVQVISGTLYDEMMKHQELLVCGDLKYTYLKFDEFFGSFLFINFTDEFSEEVKHLFEDITAVDEFNLSFGTCSQRFKDHPGFNSVFKNTTTVPQQLDK